MISIITNSLGSGDWVVIRQGTETLYEGHRPSIWELAAIFERLGHSSGIVECTDEQIEEGTY